MKEEQEQSSFTSKAIYKTLTAYYQSIQSMAGTLEDTDAENISFSVGFVNRHIKVLAEMQERNRKELHFHMEKAHQGKLTKEENNEVHRLKQQMANIAEEMAFYKSMDIHGIDESIDFLKKISYDGPLLYCLNGIAAFKNGDYNKADEELRRYFKQCPDAPHSLGVRVFARICYSNQLWNQCKHFSARGIQLCPDDLEFHQMLRDAHMNLGEEGSAQIEDEIISILEG